MKRAWVVLLVVVLVAALSAVVWAGQGRGRPGPAGEEEGVMGRGMGMMGAGSVAASGNDVYVVIHGNLLKYDSNLDLVKQVELPRAEPGMGGGRGGRGGGGMGRRGGGGGGTGHRGMM